MRKTRFFGENMDLMKTWFMVKKSGLVWSVLSFDWLFILRERQDEPSWLISNFGHPNNYNRKQTTTDRVLLLLLLDLMLRPLFGMAAAYIVCI